MNDRNQYWHANIYLQMYSQVSYNYSNSIKIILIIILLQYILKSKLHL